MYCLPLLLDFGLSLVSRLGALVGAQPASDGLRMDATTPLLPEAIEAMAEVTHGGLWANPSGGHLLARRARRAADDARDELAELFGALPSEVVFTSGGTEADNLAVLGSVGAGAPREGAALLCSAIEHPAVRMPAGRLGGIEVAVDGHGLLDLDALAKACTPDVALVSVILVNNEVGTIANLDAIAEVVRRHAPTAWLHTDAVQAHQWVDVAAAARSADLVSVGAHKFGGPKGIGLLIVRSGVELAQLPAFTPFATFTINLPTGETIVVAGHEDKFGRRFKPRPDRDRC